MSSQKEVKQRRQLELKETQICHLFDRVKIQDEQLAKLEEELFASYKNYFDFDLTATSPPIKEISHVPSIVPDTTETPPMIKLTRTKSSQTIELFKEESDSTDNSDRSINNLRAELIRVTSECQEKEHEVLQLKKKITENEMNVSLFRKQLGDKQSQITFYERHILELQSKKESSAPLITPVEERNSSDVNAEIFALKNSLKNLQDTVKAKDEDILRYHSLLKDDRDKHSLAATLMREELKVLQKCLEEEKQKCADMRSSISDSHPSKAALEQYFVQVHALEDELSQLRTLVSTLDSQLKASRLEAVRWRTLANDRLESMQKLGKDLEEHHQEEIVVYRNETEKWRDEVSVLRNMISKYKLEAGHDVDIQKLLNEKDDKIHELSAMLRHAKGDIRKSLNKSAPDSVTELTELESTNEQLLKEHEAIKKRFDQLLNRERSAREEIRELRGKLVRKAPLSSRSEKTDRSIKDQLQRKVTSLENEIVELKENLARQISINESHRIRISEDFDRWNKQKQFQQTIERLKTKLKGKEADFEKLQQTCSGYRLLIERMEREKFNLENKLKSLRSSCGFHFDTREIEMLRQENTKLILENESLTSKLEMQHHHAGGLGAAMLQQKLEGQERKIAILELSTKGSLEVRTELERLQNAISSLQKRNLCLEAENLDLKLDLEKSTNETPHLREQIQHLENYIQVLKEENAQNMLNANSEAPSSSKMDSKKVSELERTIFVLKRVVEKLQAENKRLLNGKRPCTSSADKIKRDFQRLKEQYDDSLQKVAKLEQELAASQIRAPNNKVARDGRGDDADNVPILSEELREVKEQLEQKSHLLNKVKVLLQRAALKEKELLEQVATLRSKQATGQFAEEDRNDCTQLKEPNL